MYLSIPNCFKLDEIVKSFEVAYRSFVVEKLIKEFPTRESFGVALESVLANFQPNSVINSHRYHSKVTKIKRELASQYDCITNCHKSTNVQDFDNDDVPLVSTIIDYIEIFFNPYFKDSELTNGFTPIEFSSYSEKFHLIRNNLSHPASSKITAGEAKEIFIYIKRIQLNLDEKYFWYVSKQVISDKITDLSNALLASPIKISNLEEIAFSHQRRVICRDLEIDQLKREFFGNKYRNVGSAVIFGYGGLGKTALVLEFIDQIIKDSIDNQNPHKIDFILFFTNKSELLDYSRTTGEIEIKPLRKQIKNFEELKEKIFTSLEVNSLEGMENFRGIVVIDNIETLNENGEKERILHFISESPRSIQYILTSREEESCEFRLNIKGFDISNQGEAFLNQYINENNLEISLEKKDIELLKASKGNTLILILSLLRLNDKLSSIDEIISELNSTSSTNIETVSLFMYKNTFDRILSDLNNKNTEDILNVISLYEEPADVYSISKLSKVNNITEVEAICDRLSRKLVLNKIEDSYEINEFANKFVFLKLRRNAIDQKKLISEISAYRYSRRKKIKGLEEKKTRNPKLRAIMEDWKARNSTDALAIYDAFHLYALSKQIQYINDPFKKKEIISEINDRFSEDEAMSPHPYVKFQKARVFEILLPDAYFRMQYEKITTLIINCYEEAIISINLDFRYIKSTRSYATVLWFYGQFLTRNFGYSKEPIKYLEESIRVYEELKIIDQDYFSVLTILRNCYQSIAKKSNQREYQNALREVSTKLSQNPFRKPWQKRR